VLPVFTKIILAVSATALFRQKQKGTIPVSTKRRLKTNDFNF